MPSGRFNQCFVKHCFEFQLKKLLKLNTKCNETALEQVKNMAALPYMQFYIADYLADTFHLSTEEHGAYLLLMFNYWQSGNPLPNDDTRLARVARLSNERWISVKDALQHFFNVTESGWIHERIERDLDKVLLDKQQKSQAGKASAEARKRKKEARNKQKANAGPTTAQQKLTPVKNPLQQNGNGIPTNKDTDTDTDNKNIPPTSSGDEILANENPRPKNSESNTLKSQVAEIFDYWKTARNKNDSFKLTKERDKNIRARLKDGYSVSDITRAIDGIAFSSHHMGKNDNGKIYDDIELICRNGTKLEGFRDLLSSSPLSTSGPLGAQEYYQQPKSTRDISLEQELNDTSWVQ